MRGKLNKMSEKRNIRDHKHPDIPSEMQDKHRSNLYKLPRKSSFARVRNRCIYMGRPHFVYEFF
ncbi:hypothetical protein H5410_022059 [Solanum commersonii]|uniref:Small ribosomal subunit protein uS14m n=1 Tax=Solanum commersonii TaxID=4109 RepID=A0A9J5ZDP8_SOLCO|nr:hypothetical protein H5410_022059 [Solanum commersonii]